jgi:Asp-tRNA(Asn)/Glu-tRNA(Gln) amidotransferase A subunit family amidase
MPDDTPLIELGAAAAAAQIRDGAITSEQLVAACLERIGEREPEIRAWAHLDPDLALAQARRRDEETRAGLPLGPLHGVPVGVKDIFDTAEWPTENGSPVDHGRQPDKDCAAVDLLRAAGAVIMGKTVTTEYAAANPSVTRNPHNTEHTPGGSSAGSAAAVADRMVPLAIGSQTNGSVIRPASFCGTVGFKPTFGRIPRTGMYVQSRKLDHVGVFARSVGDAALIADALFAYDARDPDSKPVPPARLAEMAGSEPPAPPVFAFVKTHAWPRGDADLAPAFEGLTAALGDACVEIDLPGPFEAAWDFHRMVMHADAARALTARYERMPDKFSDSLRAMMESGGAVLATDYTRAADWMTVIGDGLNEMFDNVDAILTPASAGAAPHGFKTTGDPAFCTMWTYSGLPAVSLPLLRGAGGLPIGAQLIGRRGDDARLLRTANWLVRHMADADR